MKGCLNENEIAEAAEWLAEIGDQELADDIKDHLEECMACKMEGLEVADIMEELSDRA